MEARSSNFNGTLLLKGSFGKFSGNLELSETEAGSPAEVQTLWDSGRQLFAAVSVGTIFVAYVAHTQEYSSFIVSTVLPACIQDAN